jgi:hypothetical protein
MAGAYQSETAYGTFFYLLRFTRIRAFLREKSNVASELAASRPCPLLLRRGN